MAEPRDIFIVCNAVDELGGLQRWAHDVSRLFAGRGHRVTLIGVEPANVRRDYGADPPYGTLTLHDRRLPRKGKSWFWKSRRASLQAAGAGRLSELFREARPGAVVIAAQVWAGEWVAQADTTGMITVGMSHESFEASKNSSRYNRARIYYEDLDIHLALTEADADAWARAGMTNVGAMPNPLMTTPKTQPTLDDRTVVTLGRLSHEKGIDMLLEAWSLVGPQYPEWRLKIFGSGPDEQVLRVQARELGLDDTQILQGQTHDIDAALSAASIYVLPSRQEGFPISVMEAMAYGLPTVAFDCAPGIRELIDDEVSGGLVVTPGNVTGMAAGLERLMKDRDLRVRLGEAGQQSVRRFSPDSVIDRWEALFTLLER